MKSFIYLFVFVLILLLMVINQVFFFTMPIWLYGTLLIISGVIYVILGTIHDRKQERNRKRHIKMVRNVRNNQELLKN